MTLDFAETLDIALTRLRRGEAAADILADYPAEAEVLAGLLAAAAELPQLEPVPRLAADAFLADRAAFMASAAALQSSPVPAGLLVRLKEQIGTVFFRWGPSFVPGKENGRMSSLLIKAIIILGILSGSAGGTAVMAAGSLPDSPLYPVKMAMEQAQLAVSTTPTGQTYRHLAMAETRTQELAQLALKGEVSEPTLARLQLEIQQVLKLAAELPEEAMQGVLTQAQVMAQTQTQEMAQIQADAQAGEAVQTQLQQANQVMTRFQQEAEAGQADPLAFRFRYGQNRPAEEPVVVEPTAEPTTEPTVEPTEEPTVEPTTEPTVEPTEEPTVEPTTEPTAEPTEEPTAEPTPDCPNGDCVPLGDENKYGADTLPTQAQQQCAGEDCEPVQSQNQYQHGEPTVEPVNSDETPADPTVCTTDCPQDQNQNQNGQSQDNGNNGQHDGGGGDSGGGGGGGKGSH